MESHWETTICALALLHLGLLTLGVMKSCYSILLAWQTPLPFSGKLILVVSVSPCVTSNSSPFFSTTCQANLCVADRNICIEHDMNQRMAEI